MSNSADLVLEQAIAEQQTEAEAATPAAEEETAPTPEAEAPSEETTPESEPEDKDVPFPKKAVNKINRKEKEIRKLRQQKRELREQVEAFKKQAEEVEPEPNEDDFDSYADYLKARQDHFNKQNKAEFAQEQRKNALDDATKNVDAEFNQVFIETRDQFFSDVPDAQEEFKKAAPLLQALPDTVVDIIFELDNPVEVMYNLSKAGKLEDLGYMSPALAAVEIVAAQNQRGQTVKSVPEPNAGDETPSVPPQPLEGSEAPQPPKPLPPAKGNTGGAKTKNSLDKMNPRELVKWANE